MKSGSRRIGEWVRAHRIDLSLLSILAVTGLAWTHDIVRIVDPDPCDEAGSYLWRGLMFMKGRWSLIDLHWGPLYGFWYGALSKIQHDPLALFYLSGTLIVVLVPLLLFTWCRREGAGRFGAFLVSFLILIYPPLLTANRRPSHFALMVLLFGLCLASLARSRAAFAGALAAGLFLASLVRPEYLLGFAGFTAAAVFLHLRDFGARTDRNALRSLALLGICALGAVIWAVGGGGGHEMGIPKELYVFRNATFARYQGTPLASLGAEELFRRLYGQATSMPTAWLHNPSEMLAHVFFFAHRTLESQLSLLRAYSYLLTEPFAWLCAAALVLLLLSSHFLKAGEEDMKLRLGRFRLGLLAMAFPPVVSSMLYGSIPQYLIPVMGALIASCVPWIRKSPRPAFLLAFAGATCAAVLLAPRDLRGHKELWPVWTANSGPRRPGPEVELATLLTMRELRPTQPLNMFFLGDNPWYYYALDAKGDNLCWNVDWPCPREDELVDLPLRKLIERKGWNLFVLNRNGEVWIRRMREGGLKRDLIAFQQRPEEFGYKVFQVPCTSRSVFVPTANLPPGAPTQAQIDERVRAAVTCS